VTVTELLPTETVTVYNLPYETNYKIQATGDSITGPQFLGSPSPPTAYTFGSAGNVFAYRAFGFVNGNDPGILRDVTLNYAFATYEDGQIVPEGRSGMRVTCKLTTDSDPQQQQQTCPLTCEATWNASPVVANWNCGGTWYTHDTGACTTFQPYLVSQ
jgi:hypothetical protein